MARILLIGDDESLLATRAEVLKRTGAYIACASAKQAKPLLERELFDVLVLCHSLSERISGDLCDFAHRRWPEIKILVVSAVGVEYPMAGTDLTSRAEPGRLIEQTKHLLERLPHHPLELVNKQEPPSDPNCKIANLNMMWASRT